MYGTDSVFLYAKFPKDLKTEVDAMDKRKDGSV